MHAISAEELLRIWELGQFRPLPHRALLLLAGGWPSTSREELEQMSIGERDAHLLELRENLFGPQYAGLAECPSCQSNIEIDFDSAAIKSFGSKQYGPFSFALGDFEFVYRVPNSTDLLPLNNSSDLEELKMSILGKCLLERRYKGAEVLLSDLPSEAIDACNAELAKRDPQADVSLSLVCPDCNHRWEVIFDIVTFVWQEISVWAGRLLRQIHTIASGYGWTEPEILALSPLRRQAYLEMLRA